MIRCYFRLIFIFFYGIWQIQNSGVLRDTCWLIWNVSIFVIYSTVGHSLHLTVTSDRGRHCYWYIPFYSLWTQDFFCCLKPGTFQDGIKLEKEYDQIYVNEYYCEISKTITTEYLWKSQNLYIWNIYGTSQNL